MVGEARTSILPSIRTASANGLSLINSSEADGFEFDSSLTVPDVDDSASSSGDSNELDVEASSLEHVAMKKMRWGEVKKM